MRRGVAEQVVEVSHRVAAVVTRRRAVWVSPVDRVVACEPIEVDTALVADGITGDEPPDMRIIVPMPQQVPARVVLVVAVLAPEPRRVVEEGMDEGIGRSSAETKLLQHN